MELTDIHLFVISLIAPVLVWIVKFWQERSGKEIPSGWLTAGVYAAAFGLALLFGLPAIPAFAGFEDPVSLVSACMQWLGDFLVNIGPFVAFATLMYNALLKRVLDGLGNKIAQKVYG